MFDVNKFRRKVNKVKFNFQKKKLLLEKIKSFKTESLIFILSINLFETILQV